MLVEKSSNVHASVSFKGQANFKSSERSLNAHASGLPKRQANFKSSFVQRFAGDIWRRLGYGLNLSAILRRAERKIIDGAMASLETTQGLEIHDLHDLGDAMIEKEFGGEERAEVGVSKSAIEPTREEYDAHIAVG